jgi:hypothetical protein
MPAKNSVTIITNLISQKRREARDSSWIMSISPLCLSQKLSDTIEIENKKNQV